MVQAVKLNIFGSLINLSNVMDVSMKSIKRVNLYTNLSIRASMRRSKSHNAYGATGFGREDIASRLYVSSSESVESSESLFSSEEVKS